MRRLRLSSASRGFTLLELLVALTVLSLVIGASIEIFSQGTNGAIQSERYLRATMIAESILNRAGHEGPLQAGSFEGTEEVEGTEFAWRMNVAEFVDNEISASGRMPAKPLTVSVEVSWDGRPRAGQVTLETMLLVPQRGRR